MCDAEQTPLDAHSIERLALRSKIILRRPWLETLNLRVFARSDEMSQPLSTFHVHRRLFCKLESNLPPDTSYTCLLSGEREGPLYLLHQRLASHFIHVCTPDIYAFARQLRDIEQPRWQLSTRRYVYVVAHLGWETHVPYRLDMQTEECPVVKEHMFGTSLYLIVLL